MSPAKSQRIGSIELNRSILSTPIWDNKVNLIIIFLKIVIEFSANHPHTAGNNNMRLIHNSIRLVTASRSFFRYHRSE